MRVEQGHAIFTNIYIRVAESATANWLRVVSELACLMRASAQHIAAVGPVQRCAGAVHQATRATLDAQCSARVRAAGVEECADRSVWAAVTAAVQLQRLHFFDGATLSHSCPTTSHMFTVPHLLTRFSSSRLQR